MADRSARSGGPAASAVLCPRAEHVGSFLRPERLLEAARAARAGRLSAERFRELQDECIREVVAFQEGLGFLTVTDGEFRRRGWSAGFIDAVAGFGLRDAALGFRDEQGERGVLPSPYARARLRRARGIAVDELRFLHGVVTTGVPKVTIPAPDVMHFFLGPRSVDPDAYPDIEEYYADLVAIGPSSRISPRSTARRSSSTTRRCPATATRRCGPRFARAARPRTRSRAATSASSTTSSPRALPAWRGPFTCAAAT